VKHLIVKTTPLVASPLDIDSVAFGLLEKLPLTHSLLLPDTEGNAMELTGSDLAELISSGRVKVYPASYRLSMA
jgi:hypothetical protein